MISLFSGEYWTLIPSATQLGCLDSPCCPWAEGVSGTGPDFVYTALDAEYRKLCIPTSRDILVIWDAFATQQNNFTIRANGVIIWFVNCTTGSGSAIVTIPAGTTTLRYRVQGCGNAPGVTDQYSFTVSCL